MLAKTVPLVLVVGKGQVIALGNAYKTIFPDNSVQGIFLTALNS